METKATKCFQALCDARNVLHHFADTAAKRDVHDGLRMVTACLGLPPLKVKKEPNTAAPPVVELDDAAKEAAKAAKDAALLIHYDVLANALLVVEETTKEAHLPERRNWIFQNAMALLKEASWALKPPAYKAPRIRDKDTTTLDEEGNALPREGADSEDELILVRRKLKSVRPAKNTPPQLSPVGGSMLPMVPENDEHQTRPRLLDMNTLLKRLG